MKRVLPIILLLMAIAWSCSEEQPSNQVEVEISGIDPRIRASDRCWQEAEGIRYAWTGSRFDFRFIGDSCKVIFELLAGVEHSAGAQLQDFFQVIVNGRERVDTVSELAPKIHIQGGEGPTEVSIVKRTEARLSEGILHQLVMSPGSQLLDPPPMAKTVIEVIGNSITCGYGNEGEGPDCGFTAATENGWMSYAAIAARNLNARLVPICYSGKGVWQNYDRSTQATMPQLWGQYSPLDPRPWSHVEEVDWVMINLGTNDFAHGIPPQEPFMASYRDLVAEVRSTRPAAGIVLLTGPMMSGERLEILISWLDELTNEWHEAGDQNIFRLDLSTQGELGYGCQWHPSIDQHQRNARELEIFLAGKLKKPEEG